MILKTLPKDDLELMTEIDIQVDLEALFADKTVPPCQSTNKPQGHTPFAVPAEFVARLRCDRCGPYTKLSCKACLDHDLRSIHTPLCHGDPRCKALGRSRVVVISYERI